MRTRKLALIAAFALCLLPPLITSAQHVAWESEPEQKTDVRPGDAIRYAFTVEEAAITEEWTALRVQLGNGLSLQKDSVAFVLAEPAALPASAEPAEQPETAEPKGQGVQWEIVPGNDGFVLLLSALSAGDTVSFAATVQTEGEVKAVVRTDAFSSEISHTLVIPPTPAPAHTIAPAPDSAAQDTVAPGGLHVLLAAAILIALGLMGTFACRRFVLPRLRSGQTKASVEQTGDAPPPEPEEKEQDMDLGR